MQAAEALQGIKNEAYRKDYWLQAWLARCHIMRKRPEAAWQLYVENSDTQDSYRLLHIIADECYGMGHFFHSAKAFQVRTRLQPLSSAAVVTCSGSDRRGTPSESATAWHTLLGC